MSKFIKKNPSSLNYYKCLSLLSRRILISMVVILKDKELEVLENNLGWEFQQNSAVDGMYFQYDDEVGVYLFSNLNCTHIPLVFLSQKSKPLIDECVLRNVEEEKRQAMLHKLHRRFSIHFYKVRKTSFFFFFIWKFWLRVLLELWVRVMRRVHKPLSFIYSFISGSIPTKF